VTEPRLALVRELERADEAAAAELSRLDDLYAATEAVGARALALEEFAARFPEERAARAGAVKEAERELAAAKEAAARVAEELRAAQAGGDNERIAAARRVDVRARDALSMAERRLREARARRDELEEEAAAAKREAVALEARAGELAKALRERPRVAADAGEPPAPGLAGVVDWVTRARAALLVARSQQAAERDAVIRQANELGSLVAGEPLPSASAAAVARGVERALEGS
jgi:chromosome segregation ATPase